MSTEPGLVSAVIINFNSGRYLSRCLEALESQSYTNLEIIIVDNGSTDGSLASLRDWAAKGRLRLLEGSNVGSSRGNNRGIRESQGEFALVLNADAFPQPDYLEKCVEALRDDPSVGTVIGKLVSEADSTVIDSAGLYFYREGLAVDRGFGQKDSGQYDRPEFVDGACCAAALYRRAMLDDISFSNQFYDESFFAFVEDAELSFRSALRGWKTLYLPDAVAQHVRGGSSQKLSEFTAFLNERNTRLFLKTSFDPIARSSDLFLQRFVLLLRSLRLLKTLPLPSRKRLRQEIDRGAADILNRRGPVSSFCRNSVFTLQGRSSFLAAAIARRIGWRMNAPLRSPMFDRDSGFEGGG